MSEDRDRIAQNDEDKVEDVEAHRLAANEEAEKSDDSDDDVEAHRLA